MQFEGGDMLMLRYHKELIFVAVLPALSQTS